MVALSTFFMLFWLNKQRIFQLLLYLLIFEDFLAQLFWFFVDYDVFSLQSCFQLYFLLIFLFCSLI
jgi:hypothetical protein